MRNVSLLDLYNNVQGRELSLKASIETLLTRQVHKKNDEIVNFCKKEWIKDTAKNSAQIEESLPLLYSMVYKIDKEFGLFPKTTPDSYIAIEAMIRQDAATISPLFELKNLFHHNDFSAPHLNLSEVVYQKILYEIARSIFECLINALSSFSHKEEEEEEEEEEQLIVWLLHNINSFIEKQDDLSKDNFANTVDDDQDQSNEFIWECISSKLVPDENITMDFPDTLKYHSTCGASKEKWYKYVNIELNSILSYLTLVSLT